MTFRAFRGSFAYELQVGKFVFQVPFVMIYREWSWSWMQRNFGLHIWVDRYGKWV